MAKINTLNYQTVASWNGSQDLFVVEQPDGTKVATPAMVKQFIEAGDFVATGEVGDGHGNILADMAKSADVNTALADKQDTLTFDNAPTASSTNPVTSGGVKTYVDDLIKTQYLETNISTLSGNSSTTIAISFDAPDGYKAIGVSEVLTSSTAVAVTGFYTERNSSLKVKCSNLYSAAVSNVTVGVSLIYVRT